MRFLLPLYYRMGLTSIYGYLRERFGMTSYRTGASFFILSRLAGATIRIFVVLNVIQLFVLDAMGVPFAVTAFVVMLMIVLWHGPQLARSTPRSAPLIRPSTFKSDAMDVGSCVRGPQ